VARHRRRDIPRHISAGELLFLLGRLLEAAVCIAAEHQPGVEKAAALVTSVFLHGTQNPAPPRPVNSSSA
jgi:hypothetical protein